MQFDILNEGTYKIEIVHKLQRRNLAIEILQLLKSPHFHKKIYHVHTEYNQVHRQQIEAMLLYS